ncbi:MAG TPA: DUF4350 domain-containing protein [Thermoanaerobaculia bacterium]|nr:DUF4350 domain-containing protein [Thermoanaerobaculia bacterium]
MLFDEAHHNLHTSGGRYKPFAELITEDGYTVTPNTAPFSADTLQGFDVLVISNARGAGQEVPMEERSRPAFTTAEVEAVGDWVEAGGALLLIADHYPIGSANRPLGDRLGVSMSNGWTEDPANRDPVLQDLLFSRDNGLLGDHPITRGRSPQERIGRVVSFLGQSLAGPPGSVPLLRLAPSAVDELPPDRKQSVSAAGRSQGLAMTLGKGRVVVMGEAAMLTSQTFDGMVLGFDSPGIDNRQLVLNILHWLSGELD